MRNFTAEEKIKLEKYYTNRPILEDHMSILYELKKVDDNIKQIQEKRKIREESKYLPDF